MCVAPLSASVAKRDVELLMTSGRKTVPKHSLHMQRRMNERPEHAVHDSLSPLLDALRAFHAVILETCLSWTPDLYNRVGCALSLRQQFLFVAQDCFRGLQVLSNIVGLRGMADARN